MFKQQQDCINGTKKTKIVLNQNKYKLGREIGSGTFGKVFEAIDQTTNRIVAIKQAFQDKKYKNRELEVISKLKNSNIIYMHDYYFIQKKQDKYLYIVMDFFETNLQSIFKQFRKQKRRFQSLSIKIMAFQLFKALYYLQKNKVCHRDLKPPNILVNTSTNELRVCDFGSAKVFNVIQKNVTYICSRYYRSPELLFEYCMYGTEVDVWSAGCILVEFLTLEPIFPGDSTLQQLIQVIKVLGVPTKQYMKKYGNFYHQQVNFPIIPQSKWEKVLKKYKPEPELVDLISKILVYDIEKRLKPIQILLHPYFKELTAIQNKQKVENLPNLLNFDQLKGFQNSEQIQKLESTYNKLKIYKQTTSIQKFIQNGGSKMETGDCTPSVQNMGKIETGDEKENPLTRTKDSISSKGQLNKAQALKV